MALKRACGEQNQAEAATFLPLEKKGRRVSNFCCGRLALKPLKMSLHNILEGYLILCGREATEMQGLI